MRDPLPDDIVWLDDILDEWPSTLRWDTKGHTPSAPSLGGRLWDGVRAQRVVEDDDGRPLALLQLVDVDLLNGTGQIEAIVDPACDASSLLRAFIVEVAPTTPLRLARLLAVADGLTAGPASGAREVGRFRRHHLRGRGRYEDVVIHEFDVAMMSGGVGAAAATV